MAELILALIFWFGLICLMIFSYIDLKTKELGNKPILAFLVIGLIIAWFHTNYFALAIGIALMGIFSVTLWMKGIVGGADSKLLIALVPYLYFTSIPNMFVSLFLFIMEFGIVGSLFGFIYLRIYGKEKEIEIPFIPIITLAYIISWIFKIQ